MARPLTQEEDEKQAARVREILKQRQHFNSPDADRGVRQTDWRRWAVPVDNYYANPTPEKAHKLIGKLMAALRESTETNKRLRLEYAHWLSQRNKDEVVT